MDFSKSNTAEKNTHSDGKQREFPLLFSRRSALVPEKRWNGNGSLAF
jgi:hypothetical protein